MIERIRDAAVRLAEAKIRVATMERQLGLGPGDTQLQMLSLGSADSYAALILARAITQQASDEFLVFMENASRHELVEACKKLNGGRL